MLKLLKLISNLFQDSGCMPVLGVQVGQMWNSQSIWSVDVCQTMVMYEQWLYASLDQIRTRTRDPRVSPSIIFKGVFTLHTYIFTKILNFIS